MGANTSTSTYIPTAIKEDEEIETRCAGCWPSKGREPIIPMTFTTDSINEGPYEYVVEKLSIWKVPVKLFATEEDMKKYNLRQQSSTPLAKQKSFIQRPEARRTSSARRSFSSYYALVPTTSSTKTQHVPPGLEEHKDSIESRDQGTQSVIPYRGGGHEKEVLSTMLNRLSSISALAKEGIVPRDPLKSLKNKLCGGNQAMKYNEDNLHSSDSDNDDIVSESICISKEANKAIGPLKTLTPGNQAVKYNEDNRHSSDSDNDGYVLESIRISKEAHKATSPLQSRSEFDENHPKKIQDLKKRDGRSDKIRNVTWISDDPDVPVIPVSSLETFHSQPSGDEAIENSISMTSLINTSMKKSTLKTPVSTATSTEDSRSTESNPTTEIIQRKGQNLKWKIIIKHHNENTKS